MGCKSGGGSERPATLLAVVLAAAVAQTAACDGAGRTEPGCPALLECCQGVQNPGQKRTCQDLHAQSVGKLAASEVCFQVLMSFVEVGSCSATLLDAGPDLETPDLSAPEAGPDLVPDVPVACYSAGQTCLFDFDCCPGLACDTTFLVCSQPCGASGGSCSYDSDCCSNLCDGFLQQCVSCRASGDSCSTGSECCSSYCDASGYCADEPQPSCYPLDSACSYDSDCCSGYCCGGYCSSSCSTCSGSGTFCTSSSECCSNDCYQSTCQGG